MITRPPDVASLEGLHRRFKARLQLALSLLRAHRFVAQLEPSIDDDPDPAAGIPAVFVSWRKALREGDVEAALDALERAFVQLEAFRVHVIEHDRRIEAFRVRWACENAPLRHQTVDSLARFYRTLPPTTSSQSKYEYVLTRRLAGPLRPERRLNPTEELIEAVTALEAMWGASPVALDDSELATLTLALRSFAHEARHHEDAAAFTASALLRRFGSLKASLGERLFNPRLSASVVETNVAVLNALSQLLTDVGGAPLRARDLKRVTGPIPRLPARRRLAPAAGEEATPSGPATGAPPPAPAPEPPTSAPIPTETFERPSFVQSDAGSADVDLSGLETEAPAGETGAATPAAFRDPSSPAAVGALAGAVAPHDAASSEAATEEGQQPSSRAFALAQLPENAELIKRYLARPRSPEVWRLDLDIFLGAAGEGVPDPERHLADRRRALDLILTADDLICLRATQEGPPTPEHKAQVRQVENAMLLLRTGMRRAAALRPRENGDLEPLLYVSDHLLWERLRLEASLKRNPRRQRPRPLPRMAHADETAAQEALLRRRHRRILVRVVGMAAALTLMIGVVGSGVRGASVDSEVQAVDLTAFLGPQLFEDARGHRGTLYVSASPAWVLLGAEDRRVLLRSLGAFAAERGFDTVSVLGPLGEPWASFKEGEVVLDDDRNEADAGPPGA